MDLPPEEHVRTMAAAQNGLIQVSARPAMFQMITH